MPQLSWNILYILLRARKNIIESITVYISLQVKRASLVDRTVREAAKKKRSKNDERDIAEFVRLAPATCRNLS